MNDPNIDMNTVPPIEYGELCGICEKPIERGQAWCGYGAGDNMHKQCLLDLGVNDVWVKGE